MSKALKFLSLLLFLLVSPILWASDKPLLEGVAHFKIETKKGILSFDQGMVIWPDHRADFEALDDFGNTMARVRLSPDGLTLTGGMLGTGNLSKRNFNRVIPLPMTQADFLAYLLYKVPQAELAQIEKDAAGRVRCIRIPKNKKNPAYEVCFDDFRKVKGRFYPFSLSVNAAKLRLVITWQSVSLY